MLAEGRRRCCSWGRERRPRRLGSRAERRRRLRAPPERRVAKPALPRFLLSPQVPRDATPEAIKRQYYLLARR